MSYKALVVVEKGTVALQEFPIPQKIAAGEILVQNKAVALNPTDWKHRDFVSPPGAIPGCDFAGVVTLLGEGVTNVKVGDRVAGFVHGGVLPDRGSFSEYVKTLGTLVWKIPTKLAFDEAAALGGIGPHTAFQALYSRQKLAHPSTPITTKTPFLVWGGATSVGNYAVQLAKASGYTVIATASPKNFDLVKSFGADFVYSYSDPATPAAIHAAHPDLHLAIDTISEKGTTALIAHSIGEKAGGGKIVTLLPVAPEAQGGVPGIEVEMTLVYTVLGRAFDMMGHHFVVSKEDKKAIEDWSVFVPSLIEAGKFKSNPLWRQEGGLAKVNDGMNLLKEGKNSGQKITYLL